MTGPTTIERLSQRQYEAFWERQPQRDPPTQYTPWDEQAEAIKSMWRDIVRAVLVALQDPSAAMSSGGKRTFPDIPYPNQLSVGDAEDCWRAMIGAVLAEDVGREGAG